MVVVGNVGIIVFYDMEYGEYVVNLSVLGNRLLWIILFDWNDMGDYFFSG